jgi:hypothetical protein
MRDEIVTLKKLCVEAKDRTPELNPKWQKIHRAYCWLHDIERAIDIIVREEDER